MPIIKKIGRRTSRRPPAFPVSNFRFPVSASIVPMVMPPSPIRLLPPMTLPLILPIFIMLFRQIPPIRPILMIVPIVIVPMVRVIHSHIHRLRLRNARRRKSQSPRHHQSSAQANQIPANPASASIGVSFSLRRSEFQSSSTQPSCRDYATPASKRLYGPSLISSRKTQVPLTN